MDPVALVQGALTPLQRARDAIQGVTDLKTNLRRRYGDYSSIIEPLKSKPEVITTNEIERELRRLTELFIRVADLLGEYTAAPADGRLTKFNLKTKRAADFKDVSKELDEIDDEVMRQLAIMNLKGAISTSEMEVLQGVDEKVDRLTSLVNDMRPPSLPEMAALPAGALVLPDSYVERAAAQEVADGLTNPEEPRTPYTVVGMGGGGKSVLASAVVRKSSVREHFRGGIFWLRVGRGAKNSLLPLLQGLAREMGAAPTDTLHGVPHVLDSLEMVQQHLGTVASTGNSPRLVVLDDVWEREVVDALLPLGVLGVKVLVTTRDRSVIDLSTGLLELGDMTEEEALELLLKTSRTVGQPGDAARTQMAKVVTLYGRLPLVLAIAGSMPVVKGKGLTAGAWEELSQLFENKAKMMRARGEQPWSLNAVLEASFDALAERKQEEFLKTAVLAPNAIASTEMLLNLWETKDTEGTREDAEGLVSMCLLQVVVGGGYRVHDLVLEFLKKKINADAEMVGKAKALQAHYLARLDVLKRYGDPEHGAGNQGLFVLDALWRSLENLSGDPGLEVASYRANLGELESGEATAEVASSFGRVGFLFTIQGKLGEALEMRLKRLAIEERVLPPDHPQVAASLNNLAGLLMSQRKYTEAAPLYERYQAIQELVLGPEHPSLATTLNNRAWCLREQGKFAEAEPLYKKTQDIYEKSFEWDNPNIATALNNRAMLLEIQGKYAEAEPLYARSQAILEKVLSPEHPHVASLLNNRAGLLESQGKYGQADPLYLRAIKIWEAALGPNHAQVATGLNNLAVLLYAQEKCMEAIPLFERALSIRMEKLGGSHPDTVSSQNHLDIVRQKDKHNEVGPLYASSLAIGEKLYGPDHPAVATALNNRALLKSQVNISKDPSMCDQSRILVDQLDWTTDETYFDADAGVRLLVRPGCLKEGEVAGPIAVFTDKRHIVESGDGLFLLSTMIDCQPSGTIFQDPQNPLVMDFLFGEEGEDSEETDDTDEDTEGKEDLAILRATYKARVATWCKYSKSCSFDPYFVLILARRAFD